MPTTITNYTGGVLYDKALIGNYETLHVKVDVSALSATQVDSDGYLKPNVILNLNGQQLNSSSSVAQVETATVAGTLTADGIAQVTVTSALLPGGSKTIPVTMADTDTASIAAGKIRTALAADADVSNFYTVGGSSTSVTLTALNAAENDSTLNIAIATGTATGLTAAPTSANTTAGVDGTTTEVPVVTVESVKVATDNGSGLSTATDCFVACATSGNLNRDVMEDVLGRSLTATEISVLTQSRFTLTES